jgi:GMP synthase (glutamine-hydrolysing)
MFRLCVLDVSDRVRFSEGKLIEDMFLQCGTPVQISSQIFAIKYDHWPAEHSSIDLKTVDDHISRYTNNTNVGIKLDRLSSDEQVPQALDIFTFITHNFDAMVISGSDDSTMDDSFPYLKTLLSVIRLCVAANFPLLGICFGSQAIMRAIKGDKAVATMRSQNKSGEYGFLCYEVRSQSPLLKNVPSNFISVAVHGDCFLEGESSVVTSTWGNQDYQIGEKCFGIQFHPEFTDHVSCMLFDDITKSDPQATIIRDAPCVDLEPGKIIAKNFIEIASNNVF